MSVTVDCGEGKCSVCPGGGSSHYLFPQLNDGERFQCSCPCHAEPTQCPVCDGPTRLTRGGTSRCVGGCYWPQGEETQ